MNILRGEVQKFLDPRKGSLKKIGGGVKNFVYFKNNRRGGAPKKLNC